MVCHCLLHNFSDSKVHGANIGPIWARQDPCGPHVGPMNLAIWVRLQIFVTLRGIRQCTRRYAPHTHTCPRSPFGPPFSHCTVTSCLTPGQNGRHFADDILRCIFVNEKFCVLIEISLKFVPKGPIDNNPELVQKMAWRRIGVGTLSEPMLTQLTDAYMRH